MMLLFMLRSPSFSYPYLLGPCCQNPSVSMYFKSHNISVGIALGYRLEDRGSRVRFPAEAGNFSLHRRIQNGSGAHSASHPRGTGVKRPGYEADHSPPSSAEVKEWVELYIHSPNTFHGVVLS
jgi:hypothetical protein